MSLIKRDQLGTLKKRGGCTYFMFKEHYKREKAHPWELEWAKMKYTIAYGDDMLGARRNVIKSYENSVNPPPTKLKEKEILLPYSDYIVPTPYNDYENNKPQFYNPFEKFMKKNKSIGEIRDEYYEKEYEDQDEDFDEGNIKIKRDYSNIKFPPYTDLANLNIEDDNEILKFVSENGLLGIFFHRYDYVFSVAPKPNFKTKKDYEVYDLQTTYKYKYINNDKTGNFKVDVTGLYGLWYSELDYKDMVAPVTEKQINDVFFPLIENPYETQFMSHEMFDLQEESGINQITESRLYLEIDEMPEGGMKKMLESLRSKGEDATDYEKAPPSSWHYTYCEPLDLFKSEAKKFQTLCRNIAKQKYLDNKKPLTEDENKLVYNNIVELKKNLRKVNPKPFFNLRTRTIDFNWKVPSLLSAYYLMLFLNITGNLNTKECARTDCSNIFIATKNHYKYCDKGCLEVQKKRNQRAID